MSKLLSDEELNELCVKVQLYAQLDDNEWEQMFGNKDGLFGLINTQKRLAVENFKGIIKLSDVYIFADGTKFYSEKALESVIGEDEVLTHPTYPVRLKDRNELRAEQRKRVNDAK